MLTYCAHPCPFLTQTKPCIWHGCQFIYIGPEHCLLVIPSGQTYPHLSLDSINLHILPFWAGIFPALCPLFLTATKSVVAKAIYLSWWKHHYMPNWYWALYIFGIPRDIIISFTDKETVTWRLLQISHLVNDQVEFQNVVSLDYNPTLWPPEVHEFSWFSSISSFYNSKEYFLFCPTVFLEKPLKLT